MHYYQFNIGDYKSHTDHLTNMEDLGYRRLLDWLYLHEKPLPIDEKQVARLVRMGKQQEEISNVLNEFFEKNTDGWVHNRVNEELAIFQSKQDIARANGKKGGRPKNQEITKSVNLANQEKTKRVNLANQQESGLQTNQEPITNNQELLTKEDQKHCASALVEKKINLRVNLCIDKFNSIWWYWPNKANKKKALTTWTNYFKKNKTLSPEKVANMIIEDISQRCSANQIGFDKMHFTTYMNGERWTDEVPVTAEQAKQTRLQMVADDFINDDSQTYLTMGNN